MKPVGVQPGFAHALIAACLFLALSWARPAAGEDLPVVTQRLVVAGPLMLHDATMAPEGAWRAGDSTSMGIDGRSLWLRLRLPASAVDRVVTVDNPLLEELQFHVYGAAASAESRLADATPLESVHTGASTPFATRPIHADADYSLRIPAAWGAVDVLVGARTAGALRVVPRVRDVHTYAHEQMLQWLLRGAYYGALLVMALYNIGLALSLRDRDYGLYVGYVLSILSLVMCLDGTTYQLVNSANGGWLGFAVIVSTQLAIGFLQFFVRDFLRLQPGSLLYRVMTVVGYIGFLGALLPMLHYSELSYYILLGMGALSVLPHLVAAALNWRRGSAPERLYAIGLLVLMVGSVLYALLQTGVIGNHLLVRHGVQVGSTLDVILLSFALATRIKQERRARERTEADAQALALRLEAVQRERQLAAKEEELQESLQRSRQLQVLGQMAGGFAHGFNNILTSMMGFAELAQERATEGHDDVQRRHLSEIQNGGRRAARLVDQLLTYSGGNRRLASNVDLVEVVERAVSLLRPTMPTRLRLEWDAPTRPAVTRLDPDRMQQAIVNLVLNALDATDGRGSVTVQLRSRDVDDSVCTSCAARFSGPFHVLQVSDTGSGIDGDLARIFVPFYTTRPADSSGLGLSVVHAVTHECGGHLRVRNRPEGGTEFEVCLPV
jgi:signal transduction histidine kinase